VTDPSSGLERHLLESRERIVAFVRARLGDADVADDVVQEASLRAVRGAPDLRDASRLPAWFHSIVLHAIADVHRRGRRDRQLAGTLDTGEEPVPPPEAVAELCRCFEPLLPTLRPEYADVLAAELREEEPAATAARLGITANNLKVRRHRARASLRSRLEETCRTCARHGCLDCSCRAL
jgi:RNA polymerase sigma-70 factor (ECF subfamily)